MATYDEEFADEGRIDLEEWDNDLEREATRLRITLVDLARADTLAAAGDKEAAAGVLERHL